MRSIWITPALWRNVLFCKYSLKITHEPFHGIYLTLFVINFNYDMILKPVNMNAILFE